MAEGVTERRRAARVTVQGVQPERKVTMSVRLVDISLSGVLMLTSRPLQQGQYAHLSTRFGRHPLEADIEVRRVSPMRDVRGDYRIGARFVALDDDTRNAMRRFLAGGTA